MPTSLYSHIESLLFVAHEPITFHTIATILRTSEKEATDAVFAFKKTCEETHRGVRVATNGNTVELVTAPENSDYVKNFTSYEKSALTSAQSETLAILGYKGPLTQSQLEEIRGVNCSIILRNLMIENLLDMIPSSTPPLYVVSTAFLKLIGITSPKELIDYHELSQKNLDIMPIKTETDV